MSNYTHTTFAQTKDRLASLLGDPSKTFWSDAELGLYIIEALRAWGLHSEYWRATGGLRTTANEAWYDVVDNVVDGSGNPIQDQSLTDRDVISEELYQLLEPQITSWAGAWPGSEMFDLTDLANMLVTARDNYLMETAQLTTTISQPIGPGTRRVMLSDTTIRVRRVSWQLDGSQDRIPLWQVDQGEIQSTSPSAVIPDPQEPKAFAVTYTPNLSLDLWPEPSANGTLHMLVCRTGNSFVPSFSNTEIGVPNDCVHLIKYKAMADLLSGDGLSRAPQFAQYCEDRWKAGLEAVRRYHSVVWSTVQGIRQPLSSLAQRDIAKPDWETTPAAPEYVAMPSWNTLVLSPRPDTVYDITLDMVRSAPVPTADGDFLQIGREQMENIYNYAQHIACLKQQGPEFEATFGLLGQFFEAADRVRQEQAAESDTYWELERIGRKEETWRPIWAPLDVALVKEELTNG